MIINALICLIILPLTSSLFSAIYLTKQLYIPGQYYSLLNFSQSLSRINQQYTIDISLYIGQTSNSAQGNSVFDFFQLPYSQYAQQVPCYQNAVAYLNNLYAQFQPCQGGCDFQPQYNRTGNSNFYVSLGNTQTNFQNDQTVLIFDNTFYPCTGGVYQSQIYLNQSLNLTIESNTAYYLMLKIICALLVLFLVYEIAYIIIMIERWRDRKGKLMRLKQEREAQQVLDQFREKGHQSPQLLFSDDRDSKEIMHFKEPTA